MTSRHRVLTRLPCFTGEEGLKVMTRTHIHCASGLFGEEGVISGALGTSALRCQVTDPAF